ncbi:hypothetical protein BU17DRAFT_101312 [Hysterangium stoloniferum]|nr:hypothetical protein BU17DRAFT_101312 [Hysterangium stoloniferum]
MFPRLTLPLRLACCPAAVCALQPQSVQAQRANGSVRVAIVVGVVIEYAIATASARVWEFCQGVLVLRCGAAGFDCGAGCTGVAVVGVAAATVVGPVPPASPLPPTIPETLCGYGVDIDAPNPKTGANPVRDIPFDPGHPTPAAAANISPRLRIPMSPHLHPFAPNINPLTISGGLTLTLALVVDA